MKHKERMLGLLLALCLSLLLVGCGATDTTTVSTEGDRSDAAVLPEQTEASASEEEIQPSEPITVEPAQEEQDREEPEGDGDSLPGAGLTLPDSGSGDDLALGRTRITYAGNRSAVSYVTSAAQLPDYPGLEQYDEAFFADHALVLVTETVASGGVEVGIASIDIDGDRATVTLSHALSEGEHTDDMATWVLWAEVDTGLDCRWSVANPALPSDTVTS